MKKGIMSSTVTALIVCALLLSGCAGNENKPTDTSAVTTVATTEAKTEATTDAPAPEYESAEIAVREINKHGNVTLEASFDDLGALGIEVADIITVTVGDAVNDIPVGTSYSDVNPGDMVCRFDTEDQKITLAINGGSFAETLKMAVKEKIEEDPGYRWDMKTDKVTVVLKEKNGYRDEYELRSLERTNERSDYAELTDREYANYREVTTPGIKAKTLYRGTTPLDSDMGRDTYIMTFIEEDGIKTVINLADSESDMKAFETFDGSYYSTCKIYCAEMSYDFASGVFAEKVRDTVKYMAENDGPYYIHCKEGKDRTGIFCAVLECYFGASYDEIKNDYMKTYTNFYRVEEGSKTYDTALATMFDKSLCAMFGTTDPKTADLKKAATDYLTNAGVTEAELAALTAKLGE